MTRRDPDPRVETKLVSYRDQAALHRAEPTMWTAGWRIRGRREREWTPLAWLIHDTSGPEPFEGTGDDLVDTLRYTESIRKPATTWGGTSSGIGGCLLLPVWFLALAADSLARRLWGATRLDVVWEREKY